VTPRPPFSQRLGAFLFHRRSAVIGFFLLATAVQVFFAARLGLDAAFTKMIPTRHPYIATFLKHAPDFGGGNRVVVAVVNTQGDIFNPTFFDTLKKITDDLMAVKGIDPSRVKSIFSPGVRYIEIVEDGFDGSSVIPSEFSPTPAQFQTVQENIIKSGQLGLLVSKDFRAALVTAEVTEQDPDTGGKLDTYAVARALEETIRTPYEKGGIAIHILGFPKLIGEIKDKGKMGLAFFVLTIFLTAAVVFAYTRSRSLTLTAVGCAVLSVVWLLGSMKMVGFGLDPMSVVIVFLIFAIAVSHAIQKINSFRLEWAHNHDSREASQASFEKLFAPGMIALATDNIGFLTILFIPIPVVREIAVSANLGAVSIALINLFLLPVLLSYLPAHWGAVVRQASPHHSHSPFWNFWDFFSSPRAARATLVLTVVALAGSLWIGKDVPIGDTHAGAPELRPTARYNRDVAAIRRHFAVGGDLLVVYAESDTDACIDPRLLSHVDAFTARVDAQPDVLTAVSLSKWARRAFAVYNEGNPKWYALPSDEENLRTATGDAGSDTGLANFDGTVLPIYIFVKDHTAQAIRRVVGAVEDFIREHPRTDIRLRLGGGNIGVEAATNDVLRKSQAPMLGLFYGMTLLVIFIFYRSWQSLVCIVVPLTLVSIFSYAMMALTGIGLKVATLPIVSVGAGVGMDYAVYMYGTLRQFLLEGMDVDAAYRKALRSTGKAVFFTAGTLSMGTGVWVLSGLQLQADMGILFAFTFVANMLAALVLLPALAHALFKGRDLTGRANI
jgi:predicted RND superfamily exporter protein